MKLGTRVRLTDAVKERLRNNHSTEHVEEFGDEVGVVVRKPADIEDWPEVAVEWGDTGLRYLYNPDDLEVLP